MKKPKNIKNLRQKYRKSLPKQADKAGSETWMKRTVDALWQDQTIRELALGVKQRSTPNAILYDRIKEVDPTIGSGYIGYVLASLVQRA